jgi:hypothetical protein
VHDPRVIAALAEVPVGQTVILKMADGMEIRATKGEDSQFTAEDASAPIDLDQVEGVFTELSSIDPE